MNERRHRKWIDRFQTSLSIRIACYGLLFQVLVCGLIVLCDRYAEILRSAEGQADSTRVYWLAGMMMLGMAVIMIHDSVQFAHRFVGPVYRFRRSVRAITEGQPVELIRLRKGDYLTEMRDELNAMIEMLEQRGVIEIKQAAPPKARAVAHR